MIDYEKNLTTKWMEPSSMIPTNSGPITAMRWCLKEIKRVSGWEIVSHPETHEIACRRKESK